MDCSSSRFYEVVKLVLLFYSFASDHMPQALMDTVLPGLLRSKDCQAIHLGNSVLLVNQTDNLDPAANNGTNETVATFTYNNISHEDVCPDSTKEDDSIQIALVGAFFHVPMLLFGIPGGWLVSKLEPNWVYASARIFTGLSSLFFGFFATSDLLLYSYPLVYGIGWVLSEVSLYNILALTFPKDSVRSRVMSLGYTITAIGYVVGYICGTQFFAIYGVQTYLFLGVIDVNVGAFYALASFKSKVSKETEPLVSPPSQNTGSIVSSPLAVLCYAQNFSIYYTFRVVAVTAPLWLQTELKLTVTDNGLTFGVPSVIHVAAMILIVFFVSTNTTRWVVIMTFIIVQGLGFLIYPFVANMTEAMVADTAARACKLVIMALSPSLLFHIADQHQLGPYAQISGSFAAIRHLGSICGSVLSGLLVTVVGFKYLCIITGALLLPLAVSTIAFSKLP